jgi:hypothetical protein
MEGKIVVEVIPTTYEGQQATSIKVSSDLEQTSSIDKIILVHTLMSTLDMDNDFLFATGVQMGLVTGVWPDPNRVHEVTTDTGMVSEALRAMREKGL